MIPIGHRSYDVELGSNVHQTLHILSTSNWLQFYVSNWLRLGSEIQQRMMIDSGMTHLLHA